MEDASAGKSRRRQVAKKEEPVVGATDPEKPIKMDYHYTWWNVNTSIKTGTGGVKDEAEDTAPPARSGHVGFMLGATDNKFFVHGGAADGKYFNDMWALDLNTKKWQKIHTYRSPSNRAYHQMAVIGPDRAFIGQPSKAIPRLVLFGGFMDGTLFNELELLPEFSVIAKGLPRATFGKQVKRTYEPPNEDHTMDVWQRISMVRLVAPTKAGHQWGKVPMPRCNHTLSVVSGKIIVMIGGWHGAFTNDVYSLDTDTWRWTHRKAT
eukprot:jgi/Tetstr1/421526/TSEL_012473.t1